jgi:hypothetical protein
MVSCRNSDDFSENDDAFTRTENLSAELQTDDLTDSTDDKNSADDTDDSRAKFVITEVRLGYYYSQTYQASISEFVKIYVLKGGNLSGYEVLSANDGEETKFTLPSVEVEKGETIVLHMRGYSKEKGAVSELGDDLTLSTHVDSSDARDLWSTNTEKVITHTDIVYILDTKENKIVDAILFTLSPKSGWAEKIAEIAEKISEDVWQGGTSTENALHNTRLKKFECTNESMSRTNLSDVISAYENNETIPNSKENWTVGNTSIGTN